MQLKSILKIQNIMETGIISVNNEYLLRNSDEDTQLSDVLLSVQTVT